MKKVLFYLAALALFFVSYLPYNLISGIRILPLIEVMFIYYFLVVSDEGYLSRILVFVVLLTFDALNNYLIGTSAVFYFLTLYIFQYQRKLFNLFYFREQWLSFIVFFTELCVIKALIIFFVNGVFAGVFQTVVLYFITIATYPLFNNLFVFLMQYLCVEEGVEEG